MSRARGFTLVEVMIALTILSMMMVAIVSSLRTFAATQGALEKTTSRVDEIRLVSGFLRRSLEAALPNSEGGGGVITFDSMYDSTAYFLGTSTELTWVAPVVGGAGLGGVYTLHLSLDGGDLVLRWQPYRDDVSELDWADSNMRVLLNEVEEFKLGYRVAYGGEWQGEWDGPQGNPVSVRMSFKVGEKYWPELLMRLD